MWFKKYSYLSGASSISRSIPATFIIWLWKSKLFKFVVLLYITFSACFTLIQFAGYTLKTEVHDPSVHLFLDSIPRTHDTNSLSPISEIKQNLRFSKIHTYSSHSLTENIYPRYFLAESEPNNMDVTVAAYITQDRLDDLIRLANIWQGPISATLHLPSKSNKYNNDDFIKNILDSVQDIYKKNPNVAMYVDMHLIMGPYKTTNTTKPAQTNIHMNVARFFARTEFIFFLDFDTWPMPGLRSRILNNSNLLLNNDVLVLPSFIFTNDASSSDFPQDKQDVIKLVKNQMLGLKDKGWELNNGPTCLHKWINNDELYKVEDYELHYTPNFVVRKSGRIPWCTERFETNKAACLLQIYLSGSELWVIPNDFLIIHQYHPDSHIFKYIDSKWQKLINSRMYVMFSREVCLQYARQFVAMGEWGLPIADHVKQECERILINWGFGLLEVPKEE